MGLATGLTRTVLTDYGFRLDRAGAGLRRRRGLLTRTDVTLPVARAQAAIVSTGPVRDALGWRDLKLQSLARDEGGGGDHVLAPLAREDEIARILIEFRWSPLPDRVDWHGVSRAYVGMLALLLVPLLVVGSIESLLMPWVALIWFPALLAILGLRWLAWRRTGYRLDGDRLLIRSGWWRRRILILPRNRIQSLEIAENLISRRFGVARVQFGVAGGSGFSSHVIPALPRETARALREELLVSPS
jgi:putative membrane protein